MSAEAEFSQQFYENSRKFFSERVDYATATALLLYWNENDINPEQEVDAIRELFEKDFGFATLTFQIPPHRAQQELNREISAFVAKFSSHSDSLVLIYYAGHGDVDDNGRSIWAANEQGGPTLSWWKAQQLLYDAFGDVLTILDCCSAALASKGDKVGGKFEILGASAKGFRTPEPGRSSFTTILIKHIRRSLKKNLQINARSLHGELLENSQLTETPQYADLGRNNPRSIVLKPLRNLQHDGFIKKPSSFLMLKVSLAEDPMGLRIAEWLKTYPPEGVTAVSVEALVLKARRLQGLVDQTAFPPGSIFGKMSGNAQKEILYRLQSLDTVISSADHSAQNSLLAAERPGIANSIKDIGQSVNAVCKAVEIPILLEPQFVDGAALPPAGDDTVITTGAEKAISLRRQLLHIAAIPQNLEIPRDALRLPLSTSRHDASPRFRSGKLESKDILVESIAYQVWDVSTDSADCLPPPPLCEIEQIERLAAQLCQPKDTSFHILPCVGYFNQPLNRSFGFVFERPLEADLGAEPIALRHLYKTATMVPLGHRIRLAHELIAALESFHRVGWVHKSISSHNIVFLPRGSTFRSTPTCVSIRDQPDTPPIKTTVLDLADPWLFGFDASRPEESDSHMREDYSLGNNIYRHPNRWGRPSMKFIKPHDVYSLGIVLLEISFWKDVLPLAEIPKPNASYKTYPLVPEKIRALLSVKCSRKLPHQVGQVFADTILSCLDFEQNTRGMTAYDQHRYYETCVVDRIAQAVGRV